MKLSVVIAAYDEAESIGLLWERLEKSLNALEDVTPEVVFVIEGTDRTQQILTEQTRHLPWVRLLCNATPSGLGAAFRRGFAAVSDDVDYVVTLDADLNHQPEEIQGLLATAIERNTDILVGSRFVAGSEVIGTPFWKRALSVGINRLMHIGYGLEVLDRTSGFRVYRASSLRQLTVHNDAFAFLPELLIAASRTGLRIAEAPIRFTYRQLGQSKMALWPTSWSYLRMLVSQCTPSTWAILALFTAGLILRIGLVFPIGKLPGEADCVLNGLCSFQVLRGEFPVFASYTRLGSIGGHLTALLSLLGAGPRFALVFGPLIESVLLMGFWYLFFREALGRRIAAVALLFVAIPSPSYNYWTSTGNGYPEVMLFCGATLWLAARAVRSVHERWPFFALGVAAGLGLWSSLQSLGCSAPAFAWLAWSQPRVWRGRVALLLVGGFLLGAAPWLTYNIGNNFPTLRSGYAADVAPGLAAKLDNTKDLLTYKIPEMIGSVDHRFWPRQTRFMRTLHPLVLGLHLAAMGLFFYLGSRARGRGFSLSGAIDARKDPRWLFALVMVTMAALNVLSVAGMTRGVTVRYIMPLYLIVPGMLACLLLWISARSRWAAGLVAAVLLTFNLTGTYLPWTVERERQVRMAANDDKLIALLEKQGVEAILGGYWQVYPINYFSQERITGLPFRPDLDHYNLEGRLDKDRPLRWAVLGPRRKESEIELLVERSGIEVKIHTRPGYRVFIAKEPMRPHDFLTRMREIFVTRQKELAPERGW